jgi:hypothetical protein
MKTNLFSTILVILVISICCFGCKGKLDGTWYFQKIEHLRTSEIETSWEGECPYMYFGNDSAFVLSNYSRVYEGKWHKKDDVIYIVYDDGIESQYIDESSSSDELVLNYINIARIYLTKEMPERCGNVTHGR